jgi:hypothetical protein
MPMTNADVEGAIRSVRVFCEHARMVINSDGPVHMAADVQRELRDLQRLLVEIPQRWEHVLATAQARGWAIK